MDIVYDFIMLLHVQARYIQNVLEFTNNDNLETECEDSTSNILNFRLHTLI